jgi:CheY-like chemotaxis protein
MNILIVEPDRILARTYASALEGRAKVSVAHCAQDAIHAADQQKPDLILLEMQMPRHNGVEFMYELRSYPEWQEVPVILHTIVPLGHIDISANMIRNLGIVNHLYKPTTTLAQLRREVDELLAVPA